MDTKSNDKCPYKRHTVKDRWRRGKDHVKTEAEIEVMQPQARNVSSETLEESRKCSPLEASGECVSAAP